MKSLSPSPSLRQVQEAVAARTLGSLSASHDADAELDEWLYVHVHRCAEHEHDRIG